MLPSLVPLRSKLAVALVRFCVSILYFRTTPLSTCHCCGSCQLGIQTNISSCNLYYRIEYFQSSRFEDRVNFKNGCTIGNACIDIVVYSCQFGWMLRFVRNDIFCLMTNIHIILHNWIICFVGTRGYPSRFVPRWCWSGKWLDFRYVVYVYDSALNVPLELDWIVFVFYRYFYMFFSSLDSLWSLNGNRWTWNI